MNFIKKKVDSFSLKSFHPYKQFSILLSETSSYGIRVETGSYLPMANYGSFDRSTTMYYLINQLFYKQKSPYYYSSKDNNLDWYKLLNSQFRVITLPMDLIGDKVKEGSFQLSGSSNSILISDNYYGQLIDNSATQIVSSSGLVGFWSFDDGYKTDSKVVNFQSINQRETSNGMQFYNTSFTTGVQSRGYCATFTGNGYGRAIEYKDMDLEKTDDFSLAFWMKASPDVQSVTSSIYNTVICKGGDDSKRYFMNVQMYNQQDLNFNSGKIRASRKDEFSESVMTSSTSIDDSTFHQVVFQKTGSTLQLYVDGALSTTTLDNTNSDVYFNDYRDDFVIGGRIESASLEVVPEFSGSVDEVRFYNRALSTTEISNLYSNPYNTNVIGNIYYKHGIIVINNLSGSYNSLYRNSTDTMKFQCVTEVREIKAEFTKSPGEFNFTLNPTVFNKTTNFSNKQLIPVVSSSFSTFTPYITTIGLMNDRSEILAVVKLKRPLKCNLDLPIKFVIRMDI